ncbi:winged helix-turn-helix transcriptional regulator [Nocardioides litoris]|uniref:winged helix-turn-helix transcriptional regulator n=1 Tax=Nocardioides litoris TaxID=1926648 RepID=UPI00111F4C55|nr:winged helix-turn-helix transcriptional regulator [Nocardioides litoris]
MDTTCGTEAATAVVGDPWSPLLLRDVARGRRRFEALLGCGISRKVLTARLGSLVGAGVLERRQYQESPARFEYHLTAAGLALLPVLAALQEWGDTWRLGPGAGARRAEELVGATVPPLDPDPLAPPAVGGPTRWTVVVAAPGPAILAAVVRSYDDRAAELAALGARLVGVATVDPDDLDDLARSHRTRSPLVSDAELRLATALRLPLQRDGATLLLQPVALVVDADRVVRAAGPVGDGLALLEALAEGQVHDVEADPSVAT